MMDFSRRGRKILSSSQIKLELSKKYPNSDVSGIIDDYLRIREGHLIDGGTIKEPMGISQVTMRRVTSPPGFIKSNTEPAPRAVKVVTCINSQISGSIIDRSYENSEFAKLLSNGRIKNE